MLPEKFDILIPPQDIATEPGLLEKLVAGDQEAFAWVYKNYCKKIFAYASVLTGSDAVSEDIVQDVFLKLWLNREKLRDVKNFNGYLYTMSRNHVINTLSLQKMETGIREHYFQNIAYASLPDEMLCIKQDEQKLSEAVSNLPKQQQIVYRLNREYGWKRKKIADELKISLFTVKCHLQKAKYKLKKSWIGMQ